MARITWQNVAAPDFSDALKGYELAGSSFGDAASQFSKAMTGAAERGREKASTAAMARALQMRDVDGWDGLLQTQGLAGLGINADQATPEFMDFLRGYREDLATDRADDLSNKRNIVGLNQAKQDLSQDQQLFDQTFEWTDYSNDRTRELNRRADQTYDRGLTAEEKVDEILNSALTPAQAMAEINNLGLDPETEKLAAAELQARGDAPFTINPEIAGSGSALPEYADISRSIQRDERTALSGYNSNDALQLYDKATSSETSFGDTMGSIREKLMDMSKRDSEDGETAFQLDPGEIQGVFEQFQAEFDGVDKEVIAAAMEASLRGAGWGAVWDGELKFDKGKVRDLLKPFTDPAQKEMLDSELQAYRDGKASRQARQAEIDRLSMAYDLYTTRGQTDRAEATRQQLAALVQQAAPDEPAPGQSTGQLNWQRQDGSAALLPPTVTAKDLSYTPSPVPQTGAPTRQQMDYPFSPGSYDMRAGNMVPGGRAREPRQEVPAPVVADIPAVSVAPAPISSAVLQSARQDPVSTVQAIVSASNLDPGLAQAAENIASQLARGNLAPRQKELLKQQLLEILAEADGGEGGPIASLVAQSKDWLPK